MPPTYQEEHDLRKELNDNLKDLNSSINESSKTSNNLQKKLILWTKVMAGAIIVQATAVAVQIFILIKITFFVN